MSDIIATSKPRILRAAIEINGRCNYKCQMCPQSTDEGRGDDFLRSMEFTEFKDILDQLQGTGVEVVNLEGSGEATLYDSLPRYIEEVSRRGMKPYIYSNGYKFRGNLMKESIDAGLALFRFSVIGYNKQEYNKWMNRDAFDRILKNTIMAKKYVEDTNSDCVIASYHLVNDLDNIEYEVEQYKKNYIDVADTQAEIWKFHNWASAYDTNEARKGKRKTCGRPHAPDITVRAGGNDGNTLAVVPCCQVSGNDHKAVLGHFSNQTLEEIWYGDKYQQLRHWHATEQFDESPYCKDCDFLIDDPETLVWTNSNLVDTQQMKGVSFSLNDYRS